MHCIRALMVLFAGLMLAAPLHADDWPQWLGPKRDSVWRETGILDRFPDGGPKVKWRLPIEGGYAGPAVADGRVYVFDYARSEGEVTNNPGKRDKLKGKERIRCLAVADGKPLWEYSYDCPYEISYSSGPRCTPTVQDGKVYTLGAEGDLTCLDAAKGGVIWSKSFKKDYKAPTPVWGFCGHPLVDGKKLICLVGGEGSVAVAFDKDNGKELWKNLSTKDQGYCPPTMIEAGGKRQLLIWHPEALSSLDPETGKVYWSEAVQPKYGMSITAPRLLGDKLYVSGIGECAALLKLAKDRPAAEIVWRGTAKTAVFCANSTPFLEDGLIFGADCQSGDLRGVKLENGERLWDTRVPTSGGKQRANHGNAFIVKNGDRFFLASETGHLIIAKLSAKGYEEISRCKLLEPTSPTFGRDVVWSHPAFADKCVFARNDKEIVCASLAKE
jgi:outer membrane protein assembly factor BamB